MNIQEINKTGHNIWIFIIISIVLIVATIILPLSAGSTMRKTIILLRDPRNRFVLTLTFCVIFYAGLFSLLPKGDSIIYTTLVPMVVVLMMSLWNAVQFYIGKSKKYFIYYCIWTLSWVILLALYICGTVL